MVILAVATIWVVLLYVFCSCVREFYSRGPHGRHTCAVCLVFRKFYILDGTVEHRQEKKMWNLKWAMCFVTNSTVTFLVGPMWKVTILFPPAKQDFHNSVPFNAFASKATTCAVIMGHSSKDMQIVNGPYVQSVNNVFSA